MRVLLVEDDERIASSLSIVLDNAGFSVDVAADGNIAWFQGDTEHYAAAILDLGLPQLDGMTILRRWRSAGRTFPVLILTARGEWHDRVDGIDSGADDYLTKPFQAEELIARLRAIIRRSAGQCSSLISAGAVSMDLKMMRVTVEGLPVSLSPQEYKLLSYLLHHRGRVVPQSELAAQLYTLDTDYESNVIEVVIGRLRKKLGVDLIKTQRGFGYVVHAEQ